ncbi:hypothetical protein ACH45_03300 [Ligilactobacillus animalis]|nr:hypothetical protein BFC98_08470 [Ligilactobacillus animalis]THE21933.1 hypothetical protein ACH45_03300 [Ligilactobacillus animalis]THE22071.1 hypothetical protein ACH44_01505 [Ligilactobacillus animalis]
MIQNKKQRNSLTQQLKLPIQVVLMILPDSKFKKLAKIKHQLPPQMPIKRKQLEMLQVLKHRLPQLPPTMPKIPPQMKSTRQIRR